MTYLVSTIRLDTGDTLVAKRCDSLAAALRTKRDVFRRHHRVDVRDVPVPFDLDFDHPDDLDRLRTGRPVWPLPVAVTIHYDRQNELRGRITCPETQSPVSLGAGVVQPTCSSSSATTLTRRA